MRKFPTFVALTILAGCAGDPSQPDRITVALAGECTTKFNPAPVPPPAIHRQVDTGTCQIQPLGAATFQGVQDIDIAAGTQSGMRTFTAANGDQLRATHTGTSVRNGAMVDFSASFTIVGGTGRYANASGQARATGSANMMTSTASFRITEGQITY